VFTRWQSPPDCRKGLGRQFLSLVLLLEQLQPIDEGCHRGSPLAVLSLMGPFVVKAIHIFIQIRLQGLQVAVDILAERDPVELVEDRLVSPLADPVGLRALHIYLFIIVYSIYLIILFMKSGRTTKLPGQVQYLSRH
jgi:hypothetical protein